MVEDEPIMINGTEYRLEDFTNEQKILLNHVTDFDAKLASARFNFDQLTVAREAFAEKLVAALEIKLEAAE